MADIVIRIEAESLAAAINNLAEAIKARQINLKEPAKIQELEKPEEPAIIQEPTKPEEPAKIQKTEKPEEPAKIQESEKPEEPAIPKEPEITKSKIIFASREYIIKDGDKAKKALSGILAKIGAKSIIELEGDKLQNFADELKALGVAI